MNRLHLDTKLEAITKGGETFAIDYSDEAKELIIAADGTAYPCELKTLRDGSVYRWVAWVKAPVASALLGRAIDSDSAIALHTDEGKVVDRVGRAKSKARSAAEALRFERGLEALRAMGSEAVPFSLNTWAFCGLKSDAGFAAERMVKEALGTSYFTWERDNYDGLPSASVAADRLIRDYEAAIREADERDAEARAEGFESAAQRAEWDERTFQAQHDL